MPKGWVELDDHLIEMHGVDPKWVMDVMDADEGRRLHRQMHLDRDMTVTHRHVFSTAMAPS